MTINIKAADKRSMDGYKAMLQELYEFIDLDIRAMPIAYDFYRDDGELHIYISDKYANYVFTFLYELFKLNQMKSKASLAKLEGISRKFREGAEEYLMSEVTLS